MNRSEEPSANTARPVVYYPDRLEHVAGPQQLTPSQAVRLSEDPELLETARRTGHGRLRLPDEPRPDDTTTHASPPQPAGSPAVSRPSKRLPFEPEEPKPSLLQRLLKLLRG